MVIVLKAMEPSWMRLGRETLGKKLLPGSNWCLAVPLLTNCTSGLAATGENHIWEKPRRGQAPRSTHHWNELPRFVLGTGSITKLVAGQRTSPGR